MSENAVADAVVTAINEQLPATVRAYKVGELPAALPATYIEVTVSRRVILDGERGDGSVSNIGYRILTRRLAKHPNNAHTLADRLEAALGFVTLPVGDQHTVVVFEGADMPAPDDGWFSAADYWICSLPDPNPK